MKLRQLFREQEEPQVADVIVFWLEGTETKQHILYNVPLDFIRAPDFEEKLRKIVRDNFRKVMIRYQVSGDTTSQGNPDGNTPDTENPNVLTSPTNDEVPPVEQKPDEMEAPRPEEEPEEDPDDRGGSIEVDIVTPEDERDEELAKAYQQERFNTIDQDRDGVHDETGEELPIIMRDGALTDPTTGEPVGAIEGTQYAERLQDTIDQGAPTPDNYVGIVSVGGGADGDTGDEGFAGEEGAVTGEQRAEIPSIIEELYRSISGLGTNETRMINALKRIGSPAHLEAVVEMYRETYNSSLPQDIIGEFRFQGGNTSKVIDEVNAVMQPLGWELVGSQWFNLRWKKDQSENTGGSSSTSTSEESTFQPTNEEREQMADANYVYDAVMSQVDQQAGYWTEVEPIEYTDADGKISFIRNPVQFFDLPTDREYSAADLQDIKVKIGDLFPLISGARLPDPENEEGGPLAITIGTGQFAYTRELEDEE